MFICTFPNTDRLLFHLLGNGDIAPTITANISGLPDGGSHHVTTRSTQPPVTGKSCHVSVTHGGVMSVSYMGSICATNGDLVSFNFTPGGRAVSA